MDRLYPVDAEAAVLGGCLYQQEVIGELTLKPAEFSSSRHQRIYTAVREMYAAGIPVDTVTLEHHLGKALAAEGSEAESVAYLAALALRCPNKDNVHAYAEIVRNGAELRRMRYFASQLDSAITRGSDLPELRSMLAAEVDRLGGDGGPAVTLADCTLANEFRPGLPSGVGLERFVPGGIPRDKVTVIFGDTGNFKTTVKNAIMFNLARAGHRVLDVSLEDSSSLTVARYLAQVHNLPYGLVASGECKVPALSEADREVLGRIVDGSKVRPSIGDIVACARANGVGAVFIDYVQLLDGCSGDHVELASAMRLAQLAAARDGVAYVLISQIKQEVKYRALTRDKTGRPMGDPRPGIRDCFGSSAISTAAKLGIGVFRPWAYCAVPTNSNSPVGVYSSWLDRHPSVEEALQVYPKILELIVDKNVLGPSGQEAATVRCLVEPETGKLSQFEL